MTSEALKETVTIINQRGLHARAAAKFVRCVTSFNAQVEVRQGDTCVEATSIMGLMMLAAKKGTMIDIVANGADARAVLNALVVLINNRFDEDE